MIYASEQLQQLSETEIIEIKTWKRFFLKKLEYFESCERL